MVNPQAVCRQKAIREIFDGEFGQHSYSPEKLFTRIDARSASFTGLP
jgi:hypothetical protein